MPWIRVVEPCEADGELARQYARIREVSGYVANILSVHSLNPGSLRSHFDLYRTLMFGQSELSRAQREMIAVVVSAANQCHY